MPKNATISLTALILIAASLLLLWFVILSGISGSTPFDKTYFLRADTSGITGARDVSQWTYFYICGQDNNDCSDGRPAPAFGWAWAGNAANVPPALIGDHGSGTTAYHYYYIWKFGWVFLLLTLIFETFAFFVGFLACCGRLGAALSYLIASVALLCYTIAITLTTACFVQARNRFQDVGRDAQIGAYAFGFLWGSYAALLIADILFIFGMRGESTKGVRSSRRFWRRRARSQSYDGRRVKEDYT